MSIKNILITGANRGIGLELCKQLSQLSTTEAIIATTRNRQNSNHLNSLSAKNQKIHVLELETRNYGHFDTFLNDCHLIVGTKGLNLLVNNAGIMSRDSLMTVTADTLSETFEVNAIAPLLLTRKLLPLLRISAKNGDTSAVVNISSILGTSVVKIQTGQEWYPYRISKASLNMITKLLASDLSEDNILAIGIHPGWVKTDMGTKNALLEPEFAVNSIVKVLSNISNTFNGKLINFDGTVLHL